jgi:hypothetical protein
MLPLSLMELKLILEKRLLKEYDREEERRLKLMLQDIDAVDKSLERSKSRDTDLIDERVWRTSMIGSSPNACPTCGKPW